MKDQEESWLNSPFYSPEGCLEQLRTEPRLTSRALRTIIGTRKASNPEIEHLYWRALAEYNPADELAAAILQRLTTSPTDRVLDLLPHDRNFLLKYLKWIAPDRLTRWRQGGDVDSAGVSPREQEEARFAAAFYSLVHDELASSQDPVSRFERAKLRLKLSRTMYRIEETTENLRRCTALVTQTIDALIDSRNSSVSRDELNRLVCQLQIWLGDRSLELADYNAAAAAHQAAILYAESAEDRVQLAMKAASSMAREGHEQEAYQLLSTSWEDSLLVSDTLIRRLWESHVQSLRYQLGIRFDKEESDRTSLPDPSENAKESHKPSGLDEYRLLSQLTYFRAAEERVREADAFMTRAENLDRSYNADVDQVTRLISLARITLCQGDSTRAVESFAELLPKVPNLLDRDDYLDFLGYYLEALAGADHESRTAILEDLAQQAIRLWKSLLSEKSNSSARSQFREDHQRSLESALHAMLCVADRIGVGSDKGQGWLSRAWDLIMTCRYPEFRPLRSLKTAEESHRLQKLEIEFHRALRDTLLKGEPDRDWLAPLQQVFQFESSCLASSPSIDQESSPWPGPSAAFFPFRELFPEDRLLVMGRSESRFSFRFSRGDGRGLSELVSGCERLTLPPDVAVADLLTCELQDIYRSPDPLAEIRVPDKAGVESSEWCFYPDRLMDTVPIEMLRGSAGSETCLGQACKVSIGLGPSPGTTHRKRADLSRGWLGLATPALHDLLDYREASDELRIVRAELEDYPAVQLTAGEANSGKLISTLAARDPAVVHLTTPVYLDPRYPEACAFILADNPENAARELLPFRSILKLDLGNVDLVVISARYGLSRPQSGRIEALVWAVLQAGATEVVACRYDIEEKATTLFMRVFYRHLRNSGTASAVQRTRDDCLNTHHLSLLQVGAWSVWV